MVEVPGRHAHPGVVPRLPESAGPRPLLPSQPFAGPRGAYPGAGEGPLLRLSQRQTKGRSGFKAPGPRVAPSGHAVTRRRSVTAPQSPKPQAGALMRERPERHSDGQGARRPWKTRLVTSWPDAACWSRAGGDTRLRLDVTKPAHASVTTPGAESGPRQAVMLQDDTCRGRAGKGPTPVLMNGRERTCHARRSQLRSAQTLHKSVSGHAHSPRRSVVPQKHQRVPRRGWQEQDEPNTSDQRAFPATNNCHRSSTAVA